MISLKEYLGRVNWAFVPVEHQKNIDAFLPKLNKFRAAYGKPMTVTSGYRLMSDHLRIYKEKGITDPNKIPMKSQHLVGLACDFSDPNGELADFAASNTELAKSLGLWFEHFSYTKGWLHIQGTPPKSGKLFFIP